MVQPDEQLVEYDGDFHFAMTQEHQVVAISDRILINLGGIEVARERMRHFLESTAQWDKRL